MAISSTEETTEELLKKIKWPDKIRNLELLGKHISVMAFKAYKKKIIIVKILHIQAKKQSNLDLKHYNIGMAIYDHALNI